MRLLEPFNRLFCAVFTLAILVIAPSSAFAASVDLDLDYAHVSVAWAPCTAAEKPCYRYVDTWFQNNSGTTTDADVWVGSLPNTPAFAPYNPIPTYRGSTMYDANGNQVLPAPRYNPVNYPYWSGNTQYWKSTILGFQGHAIVLLHAKFELTRGVDYNNHVIVFASAPASGNTDPDPHSWDEFRAPIAIVAPGVVKYDLRLNPFNFYWAPCTQQETGGGSCYRAQPMTVLNLQDSVSGAAVYCSNVDGYASFPSIQTIERQQPNGTWLSSNCTSVASYTNPAGEVYHTPIYRCPISGTIPSGQPAALRLNFELTGSPYYQLGTRVGCSASPPVGALDIHPENNGVYPQSIDYY